MSCGSEIVQSFIFNERGEVAVACLRLVGNNELIVFHILPISYLLSSNFDW